MAWVRVFGTNSSKKILIQRSDKHTTSLTKYCNLQRTSSVSWGLAWPGCWNSLIWAIDNGPASIVDDQLRLACYSNVARPDLDGGAELCNLLAFLGYPHLINQSQTTRNLPPTSSEVGSSYSWTLRFRMAISSMSEPRSDFGPSPKLTVVSGFRSAIWLIQLNLTPG